MEEKFLVFCVKGNRYAIPSKSISEVAVLDKYFPLPLVPDYIRGIINRYSIPFALIDICRFLLNDDSDSHKIIVLKEEIDKLAFLIDDILDIVDLPHEKIIKTDLEECSSARSIKAYFEWKGSNVFCIDTEELINCIKQDFTR